MIDTPAAAWTFPEDIMGWLTPTEGETLAKHARGKRVLEIGAFCGRSTVCMAQVAEHVTVIDPLDGRATTDVRDTEAELRANLERYGVADKVTILRGTTIERAGDIEPNSIDFAFIDGEHSVTAVTRDYYHAVSKLTKGGLISFHDYNSPRDEPVTYAVNRILADGARVSAIGGTVLVVRPMEIRPFVMPYIGVPSASGLLDYRTHMALNDAKRRFPLAGEKIVQFSALSMNFNMLYADALNRRRDGVTHFLMLHDDVAPQVSTIGTWADTLVGYMEAAKLGVLSAAIRIKNDSGETSTAIDGDPPRRLTREEVGPLMLSTHCPGLLINTGCMAIDIRQPWAEELVFTQNDRIARDADGKFQGQFDPEDWNMSRWLHKRGIPYGATGDIPCLHVGRKEFGP